MERASSGTAVTTALAVLLGVLTVQSLAHLPPWGWIAVPAALLGWGARRWPPLRWVAWCLLAAAWASWRGSLALDARLPRVLEGADMLVEGTLSDLPRRDSDGLRLSVRIEHASVGGRPIDWRGQAKLAWYGDAPARLPPCGRWRLLLKLKRPRGLINPGGFDSERSALERGIDATGYVREGPLNQPLPGRGWCIDGLRDRIAQAIDARVSDSHDAGLLKAFAVGDTRGLDQDDWEVARANGIPHLISISGFHVGVAAMFGVGLAWMCYLAFPRLALRLPRPPAQAVAAALVALGYGALAGMGLPTVRTLLMIVVLALARCQRRATGAAQSLALALLAILLADPLAVLSPGFWLSFVGVCFLMLCLSARGHGWLGFVRELTAGQLLMTCSLLPLTVWFFGQASLIGGLSNLLAVPVVSFLIVPLALFGMLCLLLAPVLANPAWWLAAKVAHAQWWLLERMAQWPGAHWYLPEPRLGALLLATVGALWLFTPRGLPLRVLGLALFLPLLWPVQTPLPEGAARAYVLDVGQGLAVLLRTREHALLYDAGARYRSGFDLGEAVVLPTIHALGVAQLDMLMISHADNDHAGGAAAVVKAYPAARRYAGEPDRMNVPMQACHAGQSWRWDGVQFSVLHPADGMGQGNDRSCVLLVQTASGRLLLTGDITAQVEPLVARALPAGPPLVMVSPHHGSRSSSSPSLLAAAQPQLALISAGWHSRFGHPHAQVLARYRDVGAAWLNTADSGAISVLLPAAAPPRWESRERVTRGAYWRE
jgi:competence protein ComEC